ncbi:MAG: hypothetical protein Q7U80_09885 [Thiobacillus sp.]|nr:hypothetical protein [Thiobacillus sp.]
MPGSTWPFNGFSTGVFQLTASKIFFFASSPVPSMVLSLAFSRDNSWCYVGGRIAGRLFGTRGMADFPADLSAAGQRGGLHEMEVSLNADGSGIWARTGWKPSAMA